MPRKTSGKIVDVGLDQTGTKTRVSRITTEFKPPRVPSVDDSTYISARRIRSSLIKTSIGPDGWRPPTAYRSAAALRITFPFRFRNIKSTSSIVTIEGESRPGGTYGYAPADNQFFTSLGVPSVSSNTIARAETEALNKLQDARIQLGASLVELKDTVNFIANAAQKIVQILLAVRRGNWKKIAQILGLRSSKKTKTAGEAWLAYKFGLLPLMSDIHGGLQAFNEGMKKKGAFIHVSRQVENDVTPLFIPTGNWTAARQSGYVRELAKVVIYAKISDSFIASMSSWGVLNPLSAAWEGVGWSFLLDWVLPVGNFLNSLNGTAGLTFKGGALTTRIHAELEYQTWPDISGTELVGGPCKVKYRCLATQRIPYVSWPRPWLYIKNPLSSSHASIVAALIAALRK